MYIQTWQPGRPQHSGRSGLFAEPKLKLSCCDSGEAITVYYALAAGDHAVLERCWLGSMLVPLDFAWCRSGLGLVFGFFLHLYFACVRTVEVHVVELICSSSQMTLVIRSHA